MDEVLQCLVDKDQTTYQNILGEGAVRPHLVELDNYKILEPLKGAPNLNHFLHKKRFLVIAATWKRISKITKLTKIFSVKGQSGSQQNGGNVTLIHLMRRKPKMFTDEVLQCVFDKYVMACQNI